MVLNQVCSMRKPDREAPEGSSQSSDRRRGPHGSKRKIAPPIMVYFVDMLPKEWCQMLTLSTTEGGLVLTTYS